MNAKTDAKVNFKFLGAQLLVNRVRPNPSLLLAHNTVLSKGGIARYNLTRVELKTFKVSKGSKSLSIINAVLGPIPKSLIFTMLKDTDFLGSMVTTAYLFRHYKLTNFTMYVNGKQIPNEGLSLDMDHEKTSVMGYRTLFE
jgi:hypothetical protein